MRRKRRGARWRISSPRANLTALREMALRHTAHEVEEKLAPPEAGADPSRRAGVAIRALRTPATRTERILICLTGTALPPPC